MKRTLVLISVLACMSMTFTGCGSDIETNIPAVSVNIQETANITETTEKDEPAVTETSEVTEAVSEVTESVSKAENETKNQVQNITESGSSICEKLKENAAEGSPLAKGYIASGYSEMMNRYYDVSYTDDGYKYSLNRDSVMLGTANFLIESDGTVVSASSENISTDDEQNFKRLIEYINNKTGGENYRIHDAFTEEFTETYGIPSDEDHGKNRISGKVTHIEIVLNSDLEKYNASADADKAKYTVRFEISDDGDIKSEYEYYGKAKEIRNNLLAELNALNSEYAFGIDQCVFYNWSDDVLTEVHSPFFSVDRKSVVNGEEVTFWLNKARRNTAVSESKGDTDNAFSDVYLSVYCKPGTDTSNLKLVLEELYSVTQKYDVSYINIDVLENESDFERYRNCNGIIPEETIKSEHREYHFNNPEWGWGVPGK